MRQIDSRSNNQPADNSQQQARIWHGWHLEECQAVLAGPHCAILERLLIILQNLKPASAPLLLAYVRGVDWSIVDSQTWQVVLHEVNAGIIALRTRSGLRPFDDSLPGDRDNVFCIIRNLLFPADDAAPPGAQPGSMSKATLESRSIEQ